jgi:uncharacterized glyoxalase superfamily protein PhnB
MSPTTKSADSPQHAEAGTLRGRSLQASLTMKDLHKSLAWYRDVLGFAVEQRHEREGVLRGVSVRAGEVALLLNQEDGGRGWDRIKGEGFSLQITVDESVDEIATRIRNAGGVLDSEPADMPWGARMFRIHDPDGFRLVISSGK